MSLNTYGVKSIYLIKTLLLEAPQLDNDLYAAVAAGRDPASLQGISLEAVIRTRLSLFSPLTGFR